VIADAMVEAMESLKLNFPKVEGAALKELQKVRGAVAEGEEAESEVRSWTRYR
jgi:hypothetical protein